MVLVRVIFTTQFCPMIIDGRLPVYEGLREGLFLLPEEQAKLFCLKAIEEENVSKVIIFRQFKTYTKH